MEIVRMILRQVASFLVSMLVTLIAGYFLIPLLKRLKAGQSIRTDGPVWHNKKQGTPMMGGIMFITGVTLTCLTVGFSEIWSGDLKHIFVLLLSIAYAVIGFMDDFQKFRNKRNLGLKAWQKFLLQLIVAIVFLIVMRYTGNLKMDLYIPFINITFAIPSPVYYLTAALLIVGTVNAVNLTDGVDGLATGVSIPVMLSLSFIAFLWELPAAGIFAAALTGALIAFLFYNFHPAKIIMGDTGSLFLGGAICATAFALDVPLLLFPLGIVFYIETLSVMIQVTYFKLSHCKRVFKMAPIHHHFEMCGWSEYKLFTVFTLVSAIFAALSLYGVWFRI